MRHVAAAVEYLHSKTLAHRDLKPENIVLTRKEEKVSSLVYQSNAVFIQNWRFFLLTLWYFQIVYKLTDFGYVRELGEMSSNASVVGTLNYLAPELLLQETYTRSVDYWSLGILFYEMITGTRPFLPNKPINLDW